MKNAQKAQLSIGGLLLVLAIVAAQHFLGIDLLSETSDDVSETRTAERRDDPPAVGSDSSPSIDTKADRSRVSDDAIRRLIEGEISGEMVTVEAEVVKVLPDDNEGSRHQRLLLALESGGTVLIAHNIDLAQRVPTEEGDVLKVRGQYEWNEKGGVIHWTHHDPKNWREGGWIELDGERYE